MCGWTWNPSLATSPALSTIRAIVSGDSGPDRGPLRARGLPADPVAERLAHHQVQVGAMQPGQFLGEQCDALAPRTMHAGDVGAPEHTSRTERVEYTMQRVVYAAERIWVQRIAGLTGRLHRHVRVPRQCQQLRQVAIGGVRPLCRARHTHVIDTDLQSRMTLRDLANPR